jgi:hypothetical protein
VGDQELGNLLQQFAHIVWLILQLLEHRLQLAVVFLDQRDDASHDTSLEAK